MTTVIDNTKDLNDALDDMRGKAKTLNDGLKNLSLEGFDKLTTTVLRATQTTKSGTQKSAGDIATDSAMKFARSEISTLLQSVIGAKMNGSGGGASIVINNNSTASVSARESDGPFDQKYLEITIDQMVAQSLMRGRQTSGVLRSLFGLAPGLAGR